MPGRNHPEDEQLLSITKKTIGDYRLKESHDYKAAPENRMTTLKKYHELLNARLKVESLNNSEIFTNLTSDFPLQQFKLRHEFIKKVWNIRDEKYELRNKLLELVEELKVIHEELPTDLRKSGPPIPEVNPAEFPESKLIPKIEVPEEEDEDEILEYSPATEVVVKVMDGDIVYCIKLNINFA